MYVSVNFWTLSIKRFCHTQRILKFDLLNVKIVSFTLEGALSPTTLFFLFFFLSWSNKAHLLLGISLDWSTLTVPPAFQTPKFCFVCSRTPVISCLIHPHLSNPYPFQEPADKEPLSGSLPWWLNKERVISSFKNNINKIKSNPAFCLFHSVALDTSFLIL